MCVLLCHPNDIACGGAVTEDGANTMLNCKMAKLNLHRFRHHMAWQQSSPLTWSQRALAEFSRAQGPEAQASPAQW